MNENKNKKCPGYFVSWGFFGLFIAFLIFIILFEKLVKIKEPIYARILLYLFIGIPFMVLIPLALNYYLKRNQYCCSKKSIKKLFKDDLNNSKLFYQNGCHKDCCSKGGLLANPCSNEKYIDGTKEDCKSQKLIF